MMNKKISNLLLMYLMFPYLIQDKNGNKTLYLELFYYCSVLFYYQLSIHWFLMLIMLYGVSQINAYLAIKDFYSCPYLVTCVTFFRVYFTTGIHDFFSMSFWPLWLFSCIFGHLWLFHCLLIIHDIFACFLGCHLWLISIMEYEDKIHMTTSVTLNNNQSINQKPSVTRNFGW